VSATEPHKNPHTHIDGGSSELYGQTSCWELNCYKLKLQPGEAVSDMTWLSFGFIIIKSLL
jgi:hypothetical protein